MIDVLLSILEALGVVLLLIVFAGAIPFCIFLPAMLMESGTGWAISLSLAFLYLVIVVYIDQEVF